ncbi:hypothetical protein [Azospirillum doebereinerae]|uniref:Uncharacterized protein n=1 Tax=Azospirillum doebereinerae TaxID=92933 RepID=A0A433IZX0_9PROT|nr:hypothetical protein [Azospirillum doebereinerae]RUQ61851.1 hypothetical protein EJ913_29555 [Azospirillum doebereinerae]
MSINRPRSPLPIPYAGRHTGTPHGVKSSNAAPDDSGPAVFHSFSYLDFARSGWKASGLNEAVEHDVGAFCDPLGDGDTVHVLWRNGQGWRASGPFGIATMTFDRAFDCVASEPSFWIHP